MTMQLLDGFRLHDVRVFPAERRIVRPDASLDVGKRPLEVLLTLARQPGMLLTHEDLQQALWEVASDHEDELRHVVSDLRHVLGEDADHPHFIETVPGRGYRLVVDPQPFAAGEMHQLVDKDETEPGHVGFSLEQLRSSIAFRYAATYGVSAWLLMQIVDVIAPVLGISEQASRTLIFVLLLGLPVVALAGFLRDSALWPQRRTGFVTRASQILFVAGMAVALAVVAGHTLNRRPDASGVAVLDFEHLGPAPDTRLSVGIAADLRQRLARLPGLRVAARFPAEIVNADRDLRELGDELDVRYLVQGTVQRDASGLRVSASLVNTVDWLNLWSKQVTVTESELLENIEHMVSEMAATMGVESAGGSETPARGNQYTQAYATYLQGRALLEDPNRGKLEEAKQLFGQALAADANFSEAHAGLCSAYRRSYRFDNRPADLQAARDSCDAAVALSPDSPPVLLADAELLLISGEVDAAIERFERLIDAEPRSSPGYIGLARAYASAQRAEDAERAYLVALDLLPGNWEAFLAFGGYWFRKGRYEEAAGNFLRVTEINPSHVHGFNNLGAARMMLGDFDGAARAFEESVRLTPATLAFTNLGTMYYYLKRYPDAVAMYQKALIVGHRDYRVRGNIADAYSQIAGRASDAVDVYRSAAGLARTHLENEPKDPIALASLAYFLSRVDEPAEAPGLLESAVAVAPNNVYVYYYAALVWHELGDAGKSLAALNRAAELGYPRVMLDADPLLAGVKR